MNFNTYRINCSNGTRKVKPNAPIKFLILCTRDNNSNGRLWPVKAYNVYFRENMITMTMKYN